MPIAVGKQKVLIAKVCVHIFAVSESAFNDFCSVFIDFIQKKLSVTSFKLCFSKHLFKHGFAFDKFVYLFYFVPVKLIAFKQILNSEVGH